MNFYNAELNIVSFVCKMHSHDHFPPEVHGLSIISQGLVHGVSRGVPRLSEIRARGSPPRSVRLLRFRQLGHDRPRGVGRGERPARPSGAAS